MKTSTSKLTYLKDYKAPAFTITTTKLTFVLDPVKTHVQAELAFKKLDASVRDLVLDGEELELVSVKLNGKTLIKHKDYCCDDAHLTIFNTPKAFTLTTEVIINPQANSTCSGLYLSGGIFCTQNEPHGFRRITYFLDRPDVLSKFTTTIRADARLYQKLLANGNLIKQRKLRNQQLEAVWEDPFKKPCYLFALVAGNLGCLSSHHTTPSKRKIKLKIYTTPSRIHEAKWAMQCLKKAMCWDEKEFNLECDLDLYQIVAVDDFNFGAMENKGLNIFNSRVLLASKDTATDADWLNIASVVAHEYFHNWTGNRVTLRDWFQIGLKEGLTTLREQLFMEDHYGPAYRIDSASFIKEVQFKEDAGPLAHPAQLDAYLEINNFYTATVYEKSAEIFRMVVTLAGRQGFSKILQQFLKRFDGQAATIEDFWAVAATALGPEAKQLEAWYHQVGTIRLAAEAKLETSGALKVSLKQLPPVLHPAVKTASSKPMLLLVALTVTPYHKTFLLKLTKDHEVFTIQGCYQSLPTINYLHDFSAPVILLNSLTHDELIKVAIQAKAPVDKYLALLELVKIAMTSDSGALVMAFKTYLEHAALTLLPWLLNMPAASALALALDKDLLSTDAKLRQLKELIGKKLSNLWLNVFQHTTTDVYRHSYRAIQLRRVNAIALDYLLAAKHPEAAKLAEHKFLHSNNLASSFSVLSSLVYWHHPLAKTLLDQVAPKWQHNEALTYKWLALKGASLKANDEASWQAVLTSKMFSWHNPNKVLALWRNFCGQNLVEFHDASGQGYARLTEAVVKLEAINPQVGALLAAPLTNTKGLSDAAKKQLSSCWKRILETNNLSNNVREIIAKACNK